MVSLEWSTTCHRSTRGQGDRQGLTEVEVGTRAHESRDTDTVAKLLSVTPDWKHHRPEIRFSAASYTAGNSGIFPRVELLRHLPADLAQLEDRSLHVVTTSLYKHLWEVEDVIEFQKVFVDCVECGDSLSQSMTHLDISQAITTHTNQGKSYIATSVRII